MNTGKICPQCGKSNLEGKRFCVACGASLEGGRVVPVDSKQEIPTARELREAWQAVRVRRDLRSSGAWNVLLGILILAAGFTNIQHSSCNAALFAIGLLLIGTGIAVRRTLSPITSLLSAIAMLLLALWNTALFVVAIVGSDPRLQVVGGPAFFVPIFFAVMYFRTHARFVRTQHVSPGLVADLDRETREIQKAKLAAGDDLIVLRARRRRWNGRLGAERVTLVTRNGRKVCFVSPDEFVLTARRRIAQGKQGQVTIQVGAETWTGQAPYASLERYERWKIAQQAPPAEVGLAPQEAVSHQEVIGLLQQIAGHTGPASGDASQEERIEQLVRRGPEVVPAISAAVWSVIRYGGATAQLENAGRLCEAIGRIGGPKAHEVLERLASHESGVDRVRPIQLGARRGLAALENGPALDPLPGLGASRSGPEQQAGPSGGVPLVANAVVAAGSGAETAGAVGVDARGRSQKSDHWTWVALAGGVFYLVLIVLVFVSPQLPFYLGSLMIAPTLIFMVLAKLRIVNTEQHGGGCLVALASLVAGLILYGLLFLFQREFFVQAFQALMDSGS